jgi:hypothetical protein
MTRHRRSLLALGLAIPCIFPINSVSGSETIDYSYDTRGRLIKVSRSGAVNNGVTACYVYDKADNRSNVTVATTDCSAGSAPPSFSVDDVSVTEGGNLALTVTKTGTTSSSFSLNYATASGTATSGSDYTAVSGTLTFAAAETTKTITIATINDATAESAETVFVNLSGASGGATIGDTQGIGTIIDNDSGGSAPSFSINDKSAFEGSSMTFTVTKAGTASSSLMVNYATANGTATTPSDYAAKSGTLTFAAGDVTKTITITLGGGTGFEGDELFYVNLSAASGGATIIDAQGVGTIWDDDEPPCQIGEC